MPSGPSSRAPLIGHALSAAFVRVRGALGLTQQELGDLIGCSRRTIVRMEVQGGAAIPATWATLARACYPVDPALASELAASGGTTLVELGLELAVPAPGSPEALRAATKARHLVDSVVCAGAEAMQTTPQAMRPGLVAALERAIALGMTAEQVLEAMAPPVSPAARSGRDRPAAR